MGQQFDQKYAYFKTSKFISETEGYQPGRYAFNDIPDSEKAYAGYVCYDSGDFYLEYNRGGMIQFCYPKIVAALIDSEPSSDGIYELFPFVGDEVCTRNVGSYPKYMDEGYTIGDSFQTIGSVSERLKSFMENSNVKGIYTQKFTYSASSATIYQYSENQYGCIVDYELLYDGVPITSSGGIPDVTDQENNDDDHIRSVSFVLASAASYSENGCDYVWTSPLTYDEPEEEDITDIYDYNETCQCVSQYLSPDHVFTVSDAVLQYSFIQQAAKNMDDPHKATSVDAAYVTPVWRFTLTDLDDANIKLLYVYVDATNGRIMIEKEYSNS